MAASSWALICMSKIIIVSVKSNHTLFQYV